MFLPKKKKVVSKLLKTHFECPLYRVLYLKSINILIQRKLHDKTFLSLGCSSPKVSFFRFKKYNSLKRSELVDHNRCRYPASDTILGYSEQNLKMEFKSIYLKMDFTSLNWRDSWGYFRYEINITKNSSSSNIFGKLNKVENNKMDKNGLL